MADVIVQEPIRSVYKDGSIVVSNVKSKIDNSTTSYSVVTTWYDGTMMDDSKVDQWGVYSKYKQTGEYLRENKPQWGELFIEVDTVAELRSMSTYNQFLIKIGYYKGVRLGGYYAKGDTPRPIEYYLSDTTETEDGGAIIEINGVKFESYFSNSIEVLYYGVSHTLQDNSPQFNKCLSYANIKRLTVTIANPQGQKYLFNNSINILRDTVIIGNKSYLTYTGTDTFIKCNGSSGGFLFPNIQDLTIEKLNRDKIGLGMDVTYTRNNGQFVNITFVGWDLAVSYGDSIALSFLSTFNRCRFTANNRGVLLLKEANGVIIDRCFFDNNSTYAIAVTQRASAVNIINGEFENNGKQAGGCAILVDEAQALLIQGNYFENNGFGDGLSPIIKFSSSTGLDNLGIFIKSNYFNVGTSSSVGKIGIKPYKTQDLSIESNRFYGVTHDWDIDFSLGSNTKVQGFGNSFSSTTKINLPESSLSGMFYDATNNHWNGTQFKINGNNTKVILTDNQNNNSKATIDLLNDRLRVKNQSDVIFTQFDGKTNTVRLPITYVSTPFLPNTPYGNGELAFDTTQDVLKIVKSGAWVPVTPNAALSRRGLVLQAAAQVNSTSVDIAGLVNDFNSLLTKLRDAGIISII